MLLAAETLGRFVVSKDKRTYPIHLRAHFAAGHHTHGVGLLKNGYSFGEHVDELLLIWSCSEAEELLDAVLYLPQ